MTPQEHYFMMVMTARQNAKFNILFEALKAADVIQPDDLEAYRQYTVSEKPQEFGEWLVQAWEAYQSTAAGLGITTSLEGGPYPPK